MSKAKVICKDGLFVRKDKSRSSDWVRIIPCGEEFEFYEEYNGWLKVADGWVVCNDVYIRPTEVTAGGGVSSWNDLTDKPFGEEVVTEKEVLFSQTVTDVDISADLSTFKMTYDGDLPSLPVPEGAYVTVEYKYPTTNKVFTYNKFAAYYGTVQVTSLEYSSAVTWNKSNGVYTISIIDNYKNFEESSNVTITVTLQVDHVTHNITTIDPKFLPETHQFGNKINETEVYPKSRIWFGYDGADVGMSFLEDCSIGDTVKIVIDGDEYVTTINGESDIKYIGDSSFANEPFYYSSDGVYFKVNFSIYNSLLYHYLTVYKLETVVATIDPKFLPVVKTFYIYDYKIHHDQDCKEGVSADEFMYYMSTQCCWIDYYGEMRAIVMWYPPTEETDYCVIHYASNRAVSSNALEINEVFTNEYVSAPPM